MLTLTITLDEKGRKITAHAVKHDATDGETNVAKAICQSLAELPATDEFDADLKPAESMDIESLLSQLAGNLA